MNQLGIAINSCCKGSTKLHLPHYLLLLLVLSNFGYLTANEEERFPPQHQDTQPAKQYLQRPQPNSVNPRYRGSGKLQGKVALVTGGDSGIGRAVSYLYALEGATVAFTYVPGKEDIDAADAISLIREAAKVSDAGDPIAIPTDLRYEENCKQVVDEVVSRFGCIDILVNNAAVAFYSESIQEVSTEQLKTTFDINFFSYFFMSKYALRHMKEGSSIVNSASLGAYTGIQDKLEYSTTKGAIVTFTKSLALQVIDRRIRVNGVAPNNVWTPLIVAANPLEDIVTFGSDLPIGRAAQPYEIAPSYLFLASNDMSSFITGQFIYPTGGEIGN